MANPTIIAIILSAVIFLYLLLIVDSKTFHTTANNATSTGAGEQNDNHLIPETIVRPRPILSTYEVPLYFLLCEALPKYIVLAQVSFNALLACSDIGMRNKFNRKYVDYLVVDHAFNAIAVIELDDRSHKGKVDEDNFRDDLLSTANIPVLRYNVTPTIKEVKKDFYSILRQHSLKIS